MGAQTFSVVEVWRFFKGAAARMGWSKFELKYIESGLRRIGNAKKDVASVPACPISVTLRIFTACGSTTALDADI